MSWSIHPEIKGATVADAKAKLEEAGNIPDSIKTYIEGGLDGLVAIYGEDVLVTVTGHGHLCSGADYDVTSATIEVKRAE